MSENIDLTKILKDCPKGTKFYSVIYGEVEFDSIEKGTTYPVIFITKCNNLISVMSDGRHVEVFDGVCTLFPSKDQRDWSKFRIPKKKGDIMMSYDGSCPFIVTGELYRGISPKYICGINSLGKFEKGSGNGGWTTEFYIPASEKAKKELSNKMAEAGYRWNADTLELEKIESQFKEGDVVVDKYGNLCLVSKVESPITIVAMAVLYTDDALKIYNNNGTNRLSKEITLASIEARNKFYSTLVREGYIYDKKQHKLVRQEFKPFNKVLVKNNSKDHWKADIYLNYVENIYCHYRCTTGCYKLCIPYEGNEYLLGKTINIH